MSETTTTETTTETTETVAPAEIVDWKAEAEKWKAQSRKNEDRAKANATAAKELEDLKRQSMSDQEKAIEQAKTEARAQALAEVIADRVHAAFTRAAAGRLDAEQVDELVNGINVAAFVDTDGKVDAAKVAQFIERIAPTSEPAFPDLAQGVRGSTLPLNGDPLLRDLKSKLGIR